MSNSTNYCGSSKTMGQGDMAVCGRVWRASVYQCDKCKLKGAEAIIAKQAGQIEYLDGYVTGIKIQNDLCTKENDRLAAENKMLRSELSKLYHRGVDYINADDYPDEEDRATLEAFFNECLMQSKSILEATKEQA